MKKSTSLIIVILLALVGISIYTYRSKSKLSTVDGDSRNFKFKDTAAITRIFIADKDGNHSDLKRTKKGWVVNDKYNCRNDGILNLLEVIKLIEVKMSVPKTKRENTIKYLASQALKVEIYAGDDLVRQYYVGHETEDGEGSYMLLTDAESGENYKDPYICFIPGFRGYLQPRYITNENDWRDRLVLNFTPPQMKRVDVRQAEMPADSSFSIELEGINTFKLKNGKGENLAFDDAKMRQYLIYFQNISYEALITGKNKKLQDSLSMVKPFCVISIATTDSSRGFPIKEYKFYHKQFLGDINPEHGVKYDYDPDRLYMSFDNGKEWALIQYFVFGKLLITSNYFMPASSVKK
jgi:hypothetical protein